VRQVILRQLSSRRSQDFYKNMLDDARRSLNVRPDSAAIRDFVSQKKTAREQFNEAQALSAPEARIEAYRKLLVEHPTSDVSPQAQFMVGFIYSEELKNYDEAEKAFRELLRRYPKAELAASAQWMIDHMRSEEAPAFINLDGDSVRTVAPRRFLPPPRHPRGPPPLRRAVIVRGHGPRSRSATPLERPRSRRRRVGSQSVNVVEVKVNGLILEHKTQQNIVVLRELEGERILPIWIGPGKPRRSAASSPKRRSRVRSPTTCWS